MPIYEFRCKECRNDFKKLRRAYETDEIACPTCGTERVIRVLSVTAQTSAEADASTACAMPTMGGSCLGNPAACGCRN